MNHPHDLAKSIYHATPSAVAWPDLLLHFARAGGLVSTPRAFILAAPVCLDGDLELLRHLRPFQFQTAPDAWHIYLAAGDLRQAAALLRDYPLPWVSWFRRDDGPLRVCAASRLLALARHDQA